MWIDEYVQLMFPEDYNKTNVELAMQLKEKNIPKSLYKYRSLDERGFSLDNLKNNLMRFNPANLMNDPYDSSLTLSRDITRNKMTAEKLRIQYPIFLQNEQLQLDESQLGEMKNTLTKDMYNQLLIRQNENGYKIEMKDLLDVILDFAKTTFNKKLFELIEWAQKQIFISCFSERNDSILMWSHYTNNHRGFCLEYDFNNLNNVAFNPNINRTLHPIIYSEKPFDLAKYVRTERGSQSVYNKNVIAHAAMIKAKEWSYEKEWRLIDIRPNEKEGFNLPFFKPKAIYLGAKINDMDKQELVKIGNEMQATVYQMKMQNDQFKLTAEKIL